MVGCRYGAKNTLGLNHLYLAERCGCTVRPETRVTRIRSNGAEDGSQGYVVEVMGHDAETGVFDHACRAFGYKNLLICDGSVISANLV